MRIAIRDNSVDPPKFYFAELTPAQASRHDNGAIISCGLTVPDDLRPSTLKRWLNQRIARPTSREQWNHSGCQSSCTLRGGTVCRW